MLLLMRLPEPGAGAADAVAGGVVVQVDPRLVAQPGRPARVGADVVPLDVVAVGIVGEHSLQGVAADDVAFPGGGAPDVVGVGAVEEVDAAVVGQARGPGRVGADVVAPEVVVQRGVDEDALGGVAADDVAVPGGGAPDGVAVGAVGQGQPADAVAHRADAGDVGADVVALQEVVVGVFQVHPAPGVAADDVAFPGG